MKISFDEKSPNFSKQLELIRAMGSNNRIASAQAQEAFAAFLGPVIQEVLLQAGTAGLIYKDDKFNEDDSPSYPLDLYYGETDNYVTTWSQTMAGGLPTSEVSNVREMKIATYRLDSAVSFNKKYARKSRLEVIAKAIERMTQEILVKQERNAWAVILKALGETSTAGADHIIQATTQNVLGVDDVSRLITLVRRLNTSWAGGTTQDFNSLTDLFVSPEIKQQIRHFAFNPMNTVGSQSTGPVALPDAVREGIFRAAGAEEIYGIAITDLVELGLSQKYNKLFGQFAAAGIANAGGNFSTATDEILVGLDLSAGRDAFIRPLSQQADTGGTFTIFPDDQWVTRTDKAGFYGFLEEGRVCLDSRAVVGLVV